MKNLVLLLTILVLLQKAYAGNLFGADIRYAHVEGLTWSFNVTTYVDPFAPADMPELFIGIEGAMDTIPRESQTVMVGDCFEQIQRDVYSWQHTFSGPGIYEVRAWKGTRVEAVNLSVVPDNTLCLSTEIIVASGMVNSSPVFGSPQRMCYYAGNTLVHDPMVTDPDGDSLAFYPHFPQGTGCLPLVAYMAPALSTPEGDFTILDPATGVFQWVQPNTSGTFSVAIRCTEWRDGIAIGSVTRDMTICVEAPFTSIEEADRNDPSILQPSLDGPVTVRWEHAGGSMIDILDTRGALVQRVRSTGTRTLIATDEMTPGIYLVRLTDDHGAITTGRFVVAR